MRLPERMEFGERDMRPLSAVAAAANATLLAEVSKTSPESPDLAVVRRALTSARTRTSPPAPEFRSVVAATLLRAKALSVLITAGADPTVKVAGIEHRVYNPGAVSRFIPGGPDGARQSASSRRTKDGGWRKRLFTSETPRATV